MKTPEEKAREIVNRCRINEWPDDTPMQEIAVNQLLYLIAQALKDFPEAPTEDEIHKAARDYDCYTNESFRGFRSGCEWMRKKLKGE